MSAFSQVLDDSPEYVKLKESICRKKFPMGVIGLSQAHKAHYISSLVSSTGKKALIICPNEASATNLCEDINSLHWGACLYPARDYMFKGTESKSREFEQRRIGVLGNILDGEVNYVVCSAEAAMQLTLPASELERRTLKIKVGQEFPIDKIVATLLGSGYVRADQVEGAGQFSVRGDIMDIFPPGREYPVRLEFWDETVDSISSFDTDTQRRRESISEIKIIPSSEILFDSLEAMKEKIESFVAALKGRGSVKAKENLNRDINMLSDSVRVGTDKYLSLAYEEPETIFDYMQGELVFISESSLVKQKQNAAHKLFYEDISALFEEGVLTKGLDKFTLTWNEFLKKYESSDTVYIDSLARGSFDTPVKELVSVNSQQLSRWDGTMSFLLEDIRPMLKNGYTIAVMAGTQKSAYELSFSLEAEGIKATYFENMPEEFPAGSVSVLSGTISSGIEYTGLRFALFTYGKVTRKGTAAKRKKNKKSRGLASLDELARGDYVVHATYGIGIYDGIKTLTVAGTVKDFIKINFRGSDILYLPVNQLDMISKYISPKDTDRPIRLNRLGGDEWDKTRSRVRSAVKDMAADLAKIYAERLNSKGYAFSPDMDMQNDFERRFEYEETEDQLEAVNEVKRDMERPSPMDRLLCGDVGFGKTEVALRAAFKCVADGKQCAILVPTTILAFQHYQTIKKRFDGFPVEIDMLSRFRSQGDRTKIKKALKRGSIDIIIGTHSIIAKSVEFKDLGLLIIDEEQRFGVAQKEKLKEKYPLVDVLTLSATPIPRTLNMAMSGIRDMSVLEIPPVGRSPVQTYVVPHEMDVLAQAMEKEIRRGGQVYYLHNRVDSIERRAEEIQSYLPDARIGIGHGKMNEEELSEIWRQLLEGEIDILLCTTIIETGVDVPNANTLIIENADCLGLAQLHQIRGRVGRSSRRAYAYFTYNKNKQINEVAQRRLSAIREFTEFGSGFRIAMRDLEIRGAGNILGSKQHGHMEAVGYDMYLELLSEAIEEEKTGVPVEKKKECLVDIGVDAHIPESYISLSKHRIGMYKRVAEIQSGDDAMDVIDELIDRFGEPPESVLGLVKVALYRAKAAQLGIYEIKQNANVLKFFFDGFQKEYLFPLSQEFKSKGRISESGKTVIFTVNLGGESVVETIKRLLTALSGTDEDL